MGLNGIAEGTHVIGGIYPKPRFDSGQVHNLG